MTDIASIAKCERSFKSRQDDFKKAVRKLMLLCTKCKNARQLSAAKNTAEQSYLGLKSAARIYCMVLKKQQKPAAEITHVQRCMEDAENQLEAAKLVSHDQILAMSHGERDTSHKEVPEEDVEAEMQALLESHSSTTSPNLPTNGCKKVEDISLQESTTHAIEDKLQFLDDTLKFKFQNLSLIVDLSNKLGPLPSTNECPDEDLQDIRADMDDLTECIVSIRGEFRKSIDSMQNKLGIPAK